MNSIPYGRQEIDESDIQAVIEVLKSDFLTQGPAIKNFEEQMSLYSGAKYTAAVSNATAALHLGCAALGIQKGDRVWTSPNSFVASSNCVLYLGAEVDFVDINLSTYNISVPALREKLIDAKSKNTLPKLLIIVHHSGQSCEMDKISALSREYGFKILEDASHAIGGSFQGQKIGSCQYSDLTVFSFHPVKIITTGEGGMLLTNDSKLYEKISLLRTHGITRNPELMTHSPDGPWYYQQIDLGWNYRMTDIQAALGASQLKKIDSFIDRRLEIARRYNKELQDLPVHLPGFNSESAYHLYVIRLKLERIKKTQKQVFQELHSAGIMVNLHYIPIYLQPYYRQLGFKPGQCPNSERYYSEAISLPMFSSLKDSDQTRVISTLAEVLNS